jgi:predicted TPR repeat methyltransferase
MYLIGFTPWDRADMPVPQALRGPIGGKQARPLGRALDLGCGTGRFSLYLAACS